MTERASELQRALERFFADGSTWSRYLPECLEANSGVNPDHAALFRVIPPGARVLDVGCGPTTAARLLRDKSVDYFGLDYSPFALDFAGASKERLRGLVRGNALSLPFPGETFDVVMSLRLIEYLTSPDRFLREAMRVLRPGGLFLLNGPAWEMPHLLPPSARNLKGLRRKAFISERLGRQLLYQFLRKRTYFETIGEVAAVQEGHREADDDALYLVSPYQLERFLALEGMEVLYRKKDTDRSSWPHRSGWRCALKRLALSMPPWTSGFVSTNIIARKPASGSPCPPSKSR
jgi:SAM-dependent methyltransferase